MPRRDWLLVTEDGYGEAMWEESATLYWCGRDWYVIVFERSAYRQEPVCSVTPLCREDVTAVWNRLEDLYDSYREAGQ